MTGTSELKRLQYGEEDDISMLSIAISNEKVIPDTKAKPHLLHTNFCYFLRLIHEFFHSLFLGHVCEHDVNVNENLNDMS